MTATTSPAIPEAARALYLEAYQAVEAIRASGATAAEVNLASVIRFGIACEEFYRLKGEAQETIQAPVAQQAPTARRVAPVSLKQARLLKALDIADRRQEEKLEAIKRKKAQRTEALQAI